MRAFRSSALAALALALSGPTLAQVVSAPVPTEAGLVAVTVHDLLGRTVAEVVDGEQAAGVHRATISARDLAAGVYVVRLEAGAEVRTQRITLVR